MRGEHINGAVNGKLCGGSSPHARGALNLLDLAVLISGIIPACAGSTDAALHLLICGEDHPRMRGEHRITTKTLAWAKGSSPHARGAPRR